MVPTVGVTDPTAAIPAPPAKTGLRLAAIAATRAELANLPGVAAVDAARWLTPETAPLEGTDSIHADHERIWQHAAVVRERPQSGPWSSAPSDEVVRKHFRLGATYDSRTRKVTARQRRRRHGAVENRHKVHRFRQKLPDPRGLLWVGTSTPGDGESEWRHRLTETFAEEQTVRAFPQRDVPLETTKPLPVVVSSAPGPGRLEGTTPPASAAQSAP